MDQLSLPMDIGGLIPEKHLVRVINGAIERMDIEPLLRKYKGGGTSSYHPKMMLKVLVYAYTQRIYSSRRIAKALRENIQFMWLSGNNQPDFRTINRFRGSVMKDVVDRVFTSVMGLLVEGGYVRLEHYFLDGTKIEANANRYSYVWGKATKGNKEHLQKKIKDLLADIERTNDEENEAYGDKDLEEMGEEGEITPEELERKIDELNRRLAEKPKDRALKKAVRTLEKDYLPRSKRYEEQEEKLGGRNSYSKTDEDATFMRMKEDHIRNREMKPAYNVQIGTENQFILGYSIHQRPADAGCMIPHLKRVEKLLGCLPESIIADAGYGSEENYEYLEEKRLGNYVKHNALAAKRKRKDPRAAYRLENFPYDSEKDEFICPSKRRLVYRETRRKKTENGYVSEYRLYECEDCSGCGHRELCTNAKAKRRIQVNNRLKELSDSAEANLSSNTGLWLRSRRPVEVESVFGRIKGNWSFRRFLLRGLEKVRTEWGLLCIAHNLAKLGALQMGVTC